MWRRTWPRHVAPVEIALGLSTNLDHGARAVHAYGGDKNRQVDTRAVERPALFTAACKGGESSIRHRESCHRGTPSDAAPISCAVAITSLFTSAAKIASKPTSSASRAIVFR